MKGVDVDGFVEVVECEVFCEVVFYVGVGKCEGVLV